MSINWNKIETSTGNGEYLPLAVNKLKSENEDIAKEGYWSIQNAVVLQSDLYEAAYYVIPYLTEILNVSTTNRGKVLDLLYEIFNGYAEESKTVIDESGSHIHLTIACRNKILEYAEPIQQVECSTEEEKRIKQCLLDSFKNPPPLFPSKEQLSNILVEIERLTKHDL